MFAKFLNGCQTCHEFACCERCYPINILTHRNLANSGLHMKLIALGSPVLFHLRDYDVLLLLLFFPMILIASDFPKLFHLRDLLCDDPFHRFFHMRRSPRFGFGFAVFCSLAISLGRFDMSARVQIPPKELQKCV